MGGDDESVVTWYPDKLAVSPTGTPATYQFISEVFSPNRYFRYAEFGIYEASTALHVAQQFPNCELHLFDYERVVAKTRPLFAEVTNKVVFHANSERYLDSYNWALLNLYREQEGQTIFDYCFLDGAHTFAIDGLTFFMADLLLNVGGYLDFDDYEWRLRGSSLDPERVRETSLFYTPEQIDSQHVALIVNEIVRRNPRYIEVVPNKVFQKISATE